jgi:hypothetical protein
MAPAVPATSDVDRPVQYLIASEDGTVSNDPVRMHYAGHAAAKMLVEVVDAGHFSFSNGCPLGIGNGDGCGEGTRANGEAFTFLEDARVHEITRHYQTALWGYYLKGIEAYGEYLLEQPFGEDVVIERDGMP